MSGCGFSGGFTGSGSGGGSGGGGPSLYVLPEQWVRNNVAASQTNVALSAQLSTSFDTFKVVRAGSIVALSTRLTEAVTAGQLIVEVTLNGTGTGLTLTHTSVSNLLGGIATQAEGDLLYVAGDLIGVRFTTNAGFLPITTDLESMVQVAEEL